MPSPFPGVDPYLEAQGLWAEFHSKFINAWQEALLAFLPPAYDARMDERVYLVQDHEREGRTFIPDVAIEQLPAWDSGGGGTATMVETETTTVTLALPQEYEVRESYINIVKRPERTLIAVLELLSPTNKGGERPVYLSKRDDVHSTSVHLVELDLLLSGYRLPMRDPLPPAHYYAFVSRSEKRPMADVVCWTIRRPLPKINIPLGGPTESIAIELQQVFDTAYDRGGYPRAIDYTADVRLPLSAQDHDWMRDRASKSATQETSAPTTPRS